MTFLDWLKRNEIDENTSLKAWNEATASRYSVEINYRSRTSEVLVSHAKIVLGYVSAAMKQSDYHVRQVFDEQPIRILVSTRNFDDGEWVGAVTFNPNHDGGSFIISKGFFNHDRKSISVQSSHKAKGDSAVEIVSELKSLMLTLKDSPDRRIERLRAVQLKRGPKG